VAASKKSTKFTPDVAKAICAAIENGYTKAMVAKKVNIPTDMITRWLRLGRQGHEDFRDFTIEYDASQGVAVQNMVDQVIEHSKKDWRAAAWLLERRYDQFKLKARTSEKAQKRLDELAIKKAEAEIIQINAKTNESKGAPMAETGIMDALAPSEDPAAEH
jgi:transposase-like protein